jgi:hypothetical protein
MNKNEVAELLGLTIRAIEKQLTELQANGQLKRVGPDRGDFLKVIENK